MRDNIIQHGDLLREELSADTIIRVLDGESGADILEKSDILKITPKGIKRNHAESDRSFAIKKKVTDKKMVSAGDI
ncbi:hypothetical protein INT47_009130 [Mucor saturninus]|uniref:Uncharacterized protein n=1 Tax=Mucor saturninus TaxID=64648 RepID=A0A8H7V7X2_9FUNG|nr:hypothetical protein INT47_009130 [Mucor saturninus]